jgi:hypothetical protein
MLNRWNYLCCLAVIPALAVAAHKDQVVTYRCTTKSPTGITHKGVLTLQKTKLLAAGRWFVKANWNYKNYPKISAWGAYDNHPQQYVLVFSDKDKQRRLWRGVEVLKPESNKAIGHYVWSDGTAGSEYCVMIPTQH